MEADATIEAENREGRPRQPRRWVAVVLGVLAPGFGQFYCGRVGLGVAAAAVAILVGTPIAAIALLHDVWLAWAWIAALGIAVCVVLPAHAASIARSPTNRFRSRGRLVTACLGFFFLVVAVDTLVEAGRERLIAEPFAIPSNAMSPTLLVGDYVFARSGVRDERLRGEIVILRVARDDSLVYPADSRPDLPTDHFIKRIVGVPGDRIHIHGAELEVNGVAVTGPPTGGTFVDPDGRELVIRMETLGGRTYPVLEDPARGKGSRRLVVERDRFLVLGDNRDHSNDGRYWGTVHRDDLRWTAATIYWSFDRRPTWWEVFDPRAWVGLLRDRTRWDRIGVHP